MPLSDLDLERGENAIARAQEAFESEVARRRQALFRSDGAPVYAADEQREREAEIRATAAATRDAVLQRQQESAETALAEADLTIAQVDGHDPIMQLGAEDLARAAGLREFVVENVRDQPLKKLADLVEGVLAKRDRVQAILYSRALSARVENQHTTRPVVTSPGSLSIAYNQIDATGAELQALAKRLEPLVVDPKQAERKADAEAVRRRARRLQKATRDIVVAERGEALYQQMAASGAYPRF